MIYIENKYSNIKRKKTMEDLIKMICEDSQWEELIKIQQDGECVS